MFIILTSCSFSLPIASKRVNVDCCRVDLRGVFSPCYSSPFPQEKGRGRIQKEIINDKKKRGCCGSGSLGFGVVVRPGQEWVSTVPRVGTCIVIT